MSILPTRALCIFGATACETTILKSMHQSHQVAIIGKESPFYPTTSHLSHPPDTGQLICPQLNRVFTITSSLVRYLDSDETPLYPGSLSALEKEKHTPVILHLINPHETPADTFDPETLTGQQVVLQVDAITRKKLSLQNSGLTIAQFALNRAAKELVLDSGMEDSLGSPDLWRSASTTSRRIYPENGEITLHFSAYSPCAQLEGHQKDLVKTIQELIDAWLKTKAPFNVKVNPKLRVDGPVEWQCILPQGTAKVWCSGTQLGTHTVGLSAIRAIVASISLQQNHNRYSLSLKTETKSS